MSEPDPNRQPADRDLPCLDAMVLILFNGANCLDLLSSIWPNGARTPEVVRDHEIGDFLDQHPEGQRILNAKWLSGVEVENPADVRFAMNLRRLWNSKPNKDRGEADIVAICRKTGWVAITDDRAGRGALEKNGCDFAYTTSMLVAAAATGHLGLEAENAWRIHKQIQEPFDRPFLAERKQFDQCFELVARLHKQIGAPPWPGVLRDPRVDLIVEKLDRRRLSRRLRQ